MNSGKCPTPLLIPTHSPCMPAALWHSAVLLPASCCPGSPCPSALQADVSCQILVQGVTRLCTYSTILLLSWTGLSMPRFCTRAWEHRTSVFHASWSSPSAHWCLPACPNPAWPTAPCPSTCSLWRGNCAAKEHRALSLLALGVPCGILGCQTPCNSAWVCMGWYLFSHKMIDPSQWAAWVLGDRQVSVFLWGQQWRDRALVFLLWGSFVLLLAGKQK